MLLLILLIGPLQDPDRTSAEVLRPPGKGHWLGTDGFGRSDSRQALRNFFKVDRYHIIIAALKALADQDYLPHTTVTGALEKYNIDPKRFKAGQ